MGLTNDNDARASREPLLDDLAVYALDATDGDEALAIEALLLDDHDAAEVEAVLRDAAGEYAAAVATDLGVDTDADADDATADLRARVITAAHGRRTPSPVEAAGARDVHRIEMERFEMLLRRLSDEQWQRPIDPPEFAGWTVHDLAAHVTSNEALFAQLLDITDPAAPETVNHNDDRTEQVLARHRSMAPADTVAEFRTFAEAVDARVRELSDDDLERELAWWGNPMRIVTVLVHRSFETWIHADDIRRAVGLPHVPPPAPTLKTMSSMAAGWSALMIASTGNDYAGRSVRLVLTGAGGGSYHVPLGFDEPDLAATEPDAVITVDVVDYCRRIGDRLPVVDLRYEATGDTELARELVNSLNALAVL